jgi:large subunit ribosomal protein L4e
MARGHRIDQIQEVPLVVTTNLEKITRTKDAVTVLKALGAYSDIDKVKDSRKLRAGKGKMRNRRFTMRKGPLIIYKTDNGITRAFRNIPGVDLVCVDQLNLLQLAPGGHMGRFCLWTQSAFECLDDIFGTFRKVSTVKSGYKLPRPKMTNTDLSRIINSDEVQRAVRAPKTPGRRRGQKKNPLRNLNVMLRLNPQVKSRRRQALLEQMRRKEEKQKKMDAKRGL